MVPLFPIILQAFDEWLSNRKSKWKRQRQHEVVPDSLTGDNIGPSLVPGQWQTEKVSEASMLLTYAL